jgi:hypothetical protein
MYYGKIIYYEDHLGRVWPGRIIEDCTGYRTIEWDNQHGLLTIMINDWDFWDDVVISCV